MGRKIYISLAIFVILGGIGLGYLLYVRVSMPVSKAIMAIPSNAALIIECEDFHKTWRKLEDDTNFWNNILGLDFGKELKSGALFLDSLMTAEKRIGKNLSSRPAIITAHLTGANSFHFLYLIGFDNIGELSEMEAAITKIYPQSKLRKYENVNIHEISNQTKSVFSYTFCKGIFIGSFSPGLVEDAIRQLVGGSSLLNNTINPGFEIVHFTADKNADANIYINYKFFPKLLSLIMRGAGARTIKGLSDFANWTALDLMIRPNALLFNGLTHPNDSSRKYLNLFLEQKPPKVEITKVIPDNTLAFYFLGLDNINKFYADYKNYLDNANKLFDHNRAANSINKNLGVDVEKELLPLFSGEAALITTGDLSAGKTKATGKLDDYVIMGLREDNGITEADLSVLSGQNEPNASPSHEDYRGHKIYSMNAPKIWETYLGGIFKGSSSHFFTVLDHYAIFGKSLGSMRNIIGAFIAGRTLKKEINYTLFSDNISTNANCFIYYNIPLSLKTGMLQSSLNSSLAQNITEELDTLNGFEAFAIQISKRAAGRRLVRKGNLFYTSLYLGYKDGYKEKEQLFTQAKLDAPIKDKIWIVKNHYTARPEVLVQDMENKIYHIDLSGKILWRKQLDEAIIGNIYQIDIYKNKKLQLLFNTSSRLHLLDRKGRTVEKYPIPFPSPATNGLAVFDYDNNKKYRILIACENKKIYNFDKYGKIVDGWEFDGTASKVSAAIQHFSMKGKDYIVTVDQEGGIYILDRRGETRKTVSAFVKRPHNAAFWIEKGRSIDDTRLLAADSLGCVYSVGLNNNMDSVAFGEFTYPPQLQLNDLDLDNNYEYIFLDKTELSVYNGASDLLFNEPFELNAEHGPIVRLVNNEIKVGVCSEKAEAIYLYDTKGVLHDGFPLYGNSAFEITTDEGQAKLITGVPGNYIYIYTLE